MTAPSVRTGCTFPPRPRTLKRAHTAGTLDESLQRFRLVCLLQISFICLFFPIMFSGKHQGTWLHEITRSRELRIRFGGFQVLQSFPNRSGLVQSESCEELLAAVGSHGFVVKSLRKEKRKRWRKKWRLIIKASLCRFIKTGEKSSEDFWILSWPAKSDSDLCFIDLIGWRLRWWKALTVFGVIFYFFL